MTSQRAEVTDLGVTKGLFFRFLHPLSGKRSKQKGKCCKDQTGYKKSFFHLKKKKEKKILSNPNEFNSFPLRYSLELQPLHVSQFSVSESAAPPAVSWFKRPSCATDIYLPL